jgi:hypothetical protein
MRIGFGLLAAILVSCVAAASPGAAESVPSSELSKLDLMVIASMADSPHLLTMAGYRTQKNPCASTK